MMIIDGEVLLRQREDNETILQKTRLRKREELEAMAHDEDFFSEACGILDTLEKTVKEDKKVPTYVLARLQVINDYISKGAYSYYKHVGNVIRYEAIQELIEAQIVSEKDGKKVVDKDVE